MTPLIETRGLHHVFRLEDGGQITAVHGVDLIVGREEFVALIGPNGSGKSTLARHFNALLLPTSGSVSVDGLSTVDPANLWRIRRRVGMVFQNPENQIVASTVEEDVAFGPENWGLPAAEIHRRVDDALALVGLQDQRTTPPQMLSGGQKQLLAVAGALAAQPECVVFDEPTSMLDPRGRQQVMDTIRWLNAEAGLTVVLITHAMEEAAAAGRILAMDRGRVVLQGDPRTVFEQEEQLAGLGLELPPMVDIARRLRRHGVPISPGILSLADLARALDAEFHTGVTSC